MTTDSEKYAQDYRNAGLPVPIALQKKIEAEKKAGGIPVYNPAGPTTTPTGEPVTSSTWRPDFTKLNPYEGMPADYPDKVKQGFVPTANNPLAPYVGRLVDPGSNTYAGVRGEPVKIETQVQADTLNNKIVEAAKANTPIVPAYTKNETGNFTHNSNNQDAIDDIQRINQRNLALKELSPYAVHGAEMWPAGTSEEEKKRVRDSKEAPAYNIVNYLRDDGKVETLEKAGFTEDSIKKAKEDAAKMPSKEEFMDNYLQKHYGTSNTYDVVVDRINKEGESGGGKTKDDKMFKAALKAYTDKYGKGAFVATQAADVGSVLVGPAARVLRPEVTADQITKADIAWTAANVLLLVTPFVAGKAITRIAGPGGKVAAALDREEMAMQKVLVRDNLDMLDPYRNLTAAQGKYAQKVVELKDAERTLKQVTPGAEVYAGRLESAVKAREAVKVESNALRSAGQDYVDAFKKSNNFPIDDTRLTETFDRLPGDLVKHTDDVVDDIFKSKTKAGRTIEQTQIELANTRGNIAELEAKAKALPAKATQKERLKLFRKITAEQKKAEALTRDIKKGIDNLNIESMVKTEEWKELRIRKELESRFGGGNTQTITKPKTPGKYGTRLDTEMARAGYGTKSAIALAGSAASRGAERSLRATTPEQAARERASRTGEQPLNDAVSTQAIPSANKSILKNPNAKSGDKPAEWSSSDSASDPASESQSKTSTDTKTSTKTETQPSSKTTPKISPVIKTRTATGTAKPVKTPISLKLPIVSKGKAPSKAKAVKLKPGSLTWEQGKLEVDASKPGPETVYKYGEPPNYKVKTIIAKAPAGYKDTGDTPRTTIQTLGGPVSRKVDVNMGITIAHASPDDKKITFTKAEPLSDKARRLSARAQRISDRGARLGRGMPKISNRFGRLR